MMGICSDETAGPRLRHDRSPAPMLLTVGHGTLASTAHADLLGSAGVEHVVDIRSAPGSRRHPHFSREQMEGWLPAAGIDYRWEKDGSPGMDVGDRAGMSWEFSLQGKGFGVSGWGR